MPAAAASDLSAIQDLTDERPDIMGRVLGLLNVFDIYRYGMTCKSLARFVQRDGGIWSSALEQEATLEEYLRLPQCFSAKQKLEIAVAELGTAMREARLIRESEKRLQAAPPASAALDALRQFVARTREPLHEPSSNPFMKPAKTRGVGIGGGASRGEQDQENKAINKMLDSEKNQHNISKVVVIGTDPELLMALSLQAVRFAPQGGAPPPASLVAQQRRDIRARIVRVVQTVAQEARERVGRAAAPLLQQVLAAARTEEGFAATAGAVHALWQDERIREAVAARRAALHGSLRKNLGAELELRAVERLMGPARWTHVASASYVPSPEDVATAAGSAAGVREAMVVSKGFRIRLVDPSCLMLSCKRSKLVPQFDDCELVVFALDLGQALPSRPPPDESFGLYEQLKMCEALSSSRWFRKTLVAVLANTAGLDNCLETVFQSTDAKNAKFVKARLLAMSRQPQQLNPLNIHLTSPAPDSKLVEAIVRTVADLYLSRNVQKGF